VHKGKKASDSDWAKTREGICNGTIKGDKSKVNCPDTVVKGKDEKTTCPAGSTLVDGKCKKESKDPDRPLNTRDSEDTQFARERSNNVRGGEKQTKKRYYEQVRNRKNTWKSLSAEDQAKYDGYGDYKSIMKDTYKKQRRDADIALQTASYEGSLRQGQQNKSVLSGQGGGTVLSNRRNIDSSDANDNTKQEVIKSAILKKPTLFKKAAPMKKGYYK